MTVSSSIALTDRSLLAVSGADRYDFLNNLLTQNCLSDRLPPLSAAALLSPQGKLLDEFLIWHEPDRLVLDCAQTRAAALAQKLTLYKLRSDVTIAPLDGYPWAHLSRAIGPRDPRHADLGYRSLLPPDDADPDDNNKEEVYQAALRSKWHEHRLSLGIAEGPDEMPPGAEFPLEFGLDKTHAIDFQKGCFIGQEVTSRSFRRGQRRKILVPLDYPPDLAPDFSSHNANDPMDPASQDGSQDSSEDEALSRSSGRSGGRSSGGSNDAPQASPSAPRAGIFDTDGKRVGELIIVRGQVALALIRREALAGNLSFKEGQTVQIRRIAIDRLKYPAMNCDPAFGGMMVAKSHKNL